MDMEGLESKVNDLETNILIASGILGGTAFVLCVLVITLFLMVKDMKRKLRKGEYITSPLDTYNPRMNPRGYNVHGSRY